MKSFYSILIFFLILSNTIILCQNSDLGMMHHAGKYRGMAGAGLGMPSNPSGFDLNPGNLVDISFPFLAVSQNFRYYTYSLTRWNEGHGGIIFDWQRCHYHLDNLQLAMPVHHRIAVGLGVFQKLNPFIHNYLRATTWSSLFSHRTEGSVYAIALSSSYQIHPKLSLGATLYQYIGTITSQIKGENHGDDATKWAELKNKMQGLNFRLGLIFKTKFFNTGFIFESPFSLAVKSRTNISEDKLYANYLPDYSKTTLKMPLTLGIGFAFTGIKNWLFTLDLESRQYKNSDFQINLFEFGGQTYWKDIKIIRTGLEFFPFSGTKVPLRIGYAYIPQLYASNVAHGSNIYVFDYENTTQNLKQLFTAGTTLNFQKFSIHFAFEYAFVKWHRDFYNRLLMTDDYLEKNFSIYSEIVYDLKSF